MSTQSEHVCSAIINPCTCGHRWEFKRTYSDGSVVYSTRTIRDRYLALYGEDKHIPFVACEVEP